MFLLGVLIYLVTAVFFIWLSRRSFKSIFWPFRLIIISFFYALFFGIGAVGGGGDPGFAIPAPVIFAAYYADRDSMLNNSVLPFFFWWFVIFTIMLVVALFRRYYSNPKTSN